MGRPVNLGYKLDVSGLSGIIIYEPEELVLSAAAGTSILEIQEIIGQSNQQLAFEPPNLSKLLGENEKVGTIGGTIACNLSGPRRLKAGAARDHFLGFKAISGRGDEFKSGGRVVKNVTGYDLCKLLAGSWGTLGLMTEVTIKVLPAPSNTRTILIMELGPTAAVAAMTKALCSQHDVSGGAWLPVNLAAKSKVNYVKSTSTSVTAIRIEGPEPSVEYRCEVLRKELKQFGPTEELHSHNSRLFWAEIRDVLPLSEKGDVRHIWRISVPPQTGANLSDRLTDFPNSEAFLDWGGGLLWLAVGDTNPDYVNQIRAAVSQTSGRATLVRGPEEFRSSIPVFQIQPLEISNLTKRIKKSFDPLRILNPGRMYAGI